jgi:predicted nuclease of predicted toxin-antitoxin system
LKIVVDESVEGRVVARLRADGHEVIYVAELHPGITDEEVLHLAEAQGNLLLTADKDFGDLTYLQQKSTVGIVLARLHGLSTEQKARIIAGVLRQHSEQLLDAFTVVSASSIRIRSQHGGFGRDD